MSNLLNIVDNPAEAEDADCVVCIRLTQPLAMPDNVITICSKCGEAIQHRPNAPKRPPKVCFECIKPKLNKEARKGELEIMITKKTAHEVGDFLAKKSMH